MSDTQTLIENRPPSVATLFLERVAATPDAEAYRYPVPPAAGQGPDDWKSLTWGAGRRAGLRHRRRPDRPRRAARGAGRARLLHPGRVDPRRPRRDVRGRARPPRSTRRTNAEESAFILADSGSRVLIAEDAAQLAKAREQRAELPELDACRRHRHGRRRARRGRPRGLGALARRAGGARRRSTWTKHPEAVKERVGAITADQLATLIYTSGTTGRPKGVRLPHDNWSYMAKAIAGDRPDQRGRRAVPLAAARPCLRQGADLRADRGRPRHRRRRPGRQDHRESAGGPADLHGGRAAHLREGLQRGRGQGAGRRRRQVQDLPVGGRGRPRVRQGLPGQLPPHRHGLRALRRSAPSTRSPTRSSTPSSARPSAAGCAPRSPAPPRSPPTSATSSPAPASTSWRATA